MKEAEERAAAKEAEIEGLRTRLAASKSSAPQEHSHHSERRNAGTPFLTLEVHTYIARINLSRPIGPQIKRFDSKSTYCEQASEFMKQHQIHRHDSLCPQKTF